MRATWVSIAIGGALALALGCEPGDGAQTAGSTFERPPFERPRGVAVALHREASLRHGLAWPPRLEPLEAVGANAMVLSPTRVAVGTRPRGLEADRGEADDADLRAMIRRAHRRGLAVALTPLVETRGGGPTHWRGRFGPEVPELWRAHRRWILELAELAAEEGVGALVVAHELSAAMVPAMHEHWRRLISEVRERYSGRVGVVLNHDALDTDFPFDEVDLVGVSAYFPLADDPDADKATLRVGWERAAEQLRALHLRLGRSITIMELGYPSRDGAAMTPWDDTLGAPVDLEEQRAAFAAAFDTLAALDFVDGVVVWQHFGEGGPFDRGFTPFGKPAEDVISERFARRR